MKIFIKIACLLLCISVKAQTVPDYTPSNGYWVAVSNIKVKNEATFQCYNDQNVLIHEEKITGRRSRLKKARTFLYFKQLLEKALAAQTPGDAPETKVLIDNDKIKVTEYTSQPGQEVCGQGQHTHADHTTILLTD